MRVSALPLGLAAAALALPAMAQAKTVTLTTSLKSYGGNGAYLAIYLTDAQGKFVQTLKVAGGKAKYYRHLRDWSRLSGGRVDGVTAASVGSGQTLRVSAEIADAMIDAGYQIRIDSAVESDAEIAGDVVVPLTTAGKGKPTAGKGYVRSFVFDM